MLELLLAVVLNLQSPDRILFIGDSMTANPRGWQYHLANKLSARHVVVASPGKKTGWMKDRLLETLESDGEFKACFIYGGINDAFSGAKPESVLANVQSMVDACNSRGIRAVVVVGYNPKHVMVDRTANKDSFKTNRERYIAIQSKLIQGLKNCVVVKVVEDIRRSDSSDGVHLTMEGHRKFSERVHEEYARVH